jgi:putative sigma-54 modulation protein
LKLDSHQQVKDKTAEVKLNVPGLTLFASETAKNFEAATDLAVESLRRQLKKYKEKHNLHG